MKTAISIPDAVFQAADHAAKKLGISRSELFTRAVKEMLDFQEGESVTAALDELYADETSGLDIDVVLMQFQALEQDEW